MGRWWPASLCQHGVIIFFTYASSFNGGWTATGQPGRWNFLTSCHAARLTCQLVSFTTDAWLLFPWRYISVNAAQHAVAAILRWSPPQKPHSLIKAFTDRSRVILQKAMRSLFSSSAFLYWPAIDRIEETSRHADNLAKRKRTWIFKTSYQLLHLGSLP